MNRLPDPDTNSSSPSAPSLNGQKPSRDAVLHTVESIIASGALGTSDRRSNLLSYLVNQELEGRGAQIKAFSIAIDVLGRDASFDPNTDSIVRSEIGRLRDALKLYSAEMASSDDVKIEIPKGTYRPNISTRAAERNPRFIRHFGRTAALGLCVALVVVLGVLYKTFPRDTPEALAARTPISDLPYDLVRVAVAPFSGTGNNPDADQLAFGIYSELSLSLSAYPWISVVSPIGGIETLEPSAVDYVLIGDLHWTADSILTSARLVGIDDQKVVWADSQTLSPETATIRKSVTDVTSQIVFELASTHGIAPQLVQRQNASSSSEHMTAFICFLRLYSYLEGPTDIVHLALRDCLLEALEEFPEFGDGWAALALIYFDEARFNRNERPDGDPWSDAKYAVDQALKHAPLRMPTLNVALIHSIESPEQDRVAFERFASLLLHLYPRHPRTLNNVGSRMAEFTGQWDRGLLLIDEAIYLELEPSSSFYVTNAYRVAVSGNDEEALASVEPLAAASSESQLLLKYLAAARNGLLSDMRANRDLLSQQGLATDHDIIEHVLNRRFVEELEIALIDQLENAFKIEANQ